MSLIGRLADQVLEKHPDRAASVLERQGASETTRLLGRSRASVAAQIMRRLSPQFGAAVLHQLEPRAAARILEAMPLESAARALRRLEERARTEIGRELEPKRSRSLSTLLDFPERSAGALMDPEVLALPQDLLAKEALERVRAAPEQSRYNLYVVDPSQRLVGALTLRELLLARPRSSLSTIMVRDPYRVGASDDRATVMSHPGWKEVHSLPVVDDGGAYLGVIRYRTLREIEEELLAPRSRDEDASAAFARLISAGAGGLLDALAGAPGTSRGGGADDE